MIQPKGFAPLPSSWTSETEQFASADGKLKLFAVHHHKKVGGARVLAVLHGLNEHGGRYLHLAHHLESSIDGLYCLDHRGHGRSEGLRGHVESFDLFCDDAAAALFRLDAELKSRFGHSEIHLLGHSMGGLVALRTLFLHAGLPIRSATVTAPLLGIRVKLPVVKRGAAQILSRVWSTLHMEAEIDPKLLSHDPEVVRAYVDDRLVHKKATPRLYVTMTQAIADTMTRHSGIDHPLLMVVPEQDQVVDPEASLGFFRNLKSREKLLKTFPTFFHEPMNEIGKEQVFAEISAWIAKHGAPAAGVTEAGSAAAAAAAAAAAIKPKKGTHS